MANPQTLQLMTADTYKYHGGVFSEEWRIFLHGIPVVVSDNVMSFEHRKDWDVSDYPIESGSFESFDKVEIAYTSRIRFSAGGSQAKQQALLDSIAAISGTLTLFDIATADAIYLSCTITHFDYRQTAESGTGLIVIDVWVREVRQTTSPAQTNTAAPSGADSINQGPVQPQTVAPNSSLQAGVAGNSIGDASNVPSLVGQPFPTV